MLSIQREVEVAEFRFDGRPALCVDLDGTLLAADMLYESFLRLLRQAPWEIWRVPLWLMQGKACLKRELAVRVTFELAGLPTNRDVLAWLQEEYASGRRLVLVSAADHSLANAVAKHFGIFDTVIGSDGRTNLAGNKKLAAIVERISNDFDYAGDSPVDKPIFMHARRAILVGDTDRLTRMLPSSVEIERRFPTRAGSQLRSWATALRLYQWAKNTLVFIPVLLAGAGTDLLPWLSAGLAFFMLGLFASAGYIFNDLLDLDADRQHPNKRRRPFAAGQRAIREGLLAIPLLVAAACLVGIFLPLLAFGLGVFYFATSIGYSIWLKRVPMLDVVVLAGLFTIRILTGVLAAEVAISFWLLTFSMFFFLNLAMVKRYAELREHTSPEKTKLVHRDYTAADAPLLLATGGGAVMASGTIFMIYLLQEEFPRLLYENPSFLWLIFPVLLFWMMRVWHMTIHGRMHEDPVLFALRDPVSLVLGVVTVGCIALAW